MKKFWVFAVAIASMAMVGTASAVTIDFEDGTYFAPINNQYLPQGVQFGSGWEYYAFDSNYPPHSGQFSAVLRQTVGSIDFTAPVANVSAYFNVYAYPLTWSAFDASNNLLGSIVISTTSQPTPGGMRFFSLGFQNIARVQFSTASANFFNVDDLSFDAVAVTEPSSWFLFGIGVVALLVGMRRRAI